MITLYTKNGLGNQIWQYMLVRHYATKHNLKLVHGGQHPQHKNGNVIHAKEFTLPYIFNHIQWPSGRILTGEPLIIDKDWEFPPFNHPPTQPIVYMGYDADKNLLPNRPIMKTWLTTKKKLISTLRNVIHIRLTDTHQYYVRKRYNYYIIEKIRFFKQAIRLLNLSIPTEIITDDPNHFIIKTIRNCYDLPIYHTSSWIDAWYRLAESTTIVSYRSTFSWWATILGCATHLIDNKNQTFIATDNITSNAIITQL